MEFIKIVLMVLLYLLPCLALFLNVFHDRLRCPFWAVLVLCGGLLCIAVAASTYFLTETAYSQSLRGIFSVVFVALFLFCTFFIFKYTVPQQLFVLFLIRNYLDTVDLFSSSFEYIHYNRFLGSDQYFTTFPLKAVIIAITFPLFWLFIKRLLRPILDQTEHMEFWKLIWLIPCCFFTIYQLCLSYLESYPPIALQIYFVPYAWTLCTFLSYYIILRMLSETHLKGRLEEQLHISDIQLAAQEKQFAALQEKITLTNQTRHDMRHYLRVIQQFAQEKDYQAIENYLEEYISIWNTDTTRTYSANPSIDAIIHYYADLAERAKIPASVTCTIPSGLPYIESDICIILGNLLENALEACTRTPVAEPYIHLKMALSDTNVLTIIVANSYCGEIKCKNNIFCSSKRNSTGIGIASVKSIAKKYYGITKFEFDRLTFTASVLLSSSKTVWKD